MDGTDRSLTGFGAFKVHVSKQLTSYDINILATYFEFEPALREKAQGNGLEFVEKLVERGLITENDISKLLDALEKSGLDGKKSNIHHAFERYRKDASQDSSYTPTVLHLICEEDCSEESNSIATEVIDLTSNSQNIEESFFHCSICEVYVELETDLYCSTYNNLPVCLACANVSDAEHTTGDMKFLTAKEKIQVEELLEQCNEKYEELIKGIKNTINSKEKIDNQAAQKMKDQYESEMVAIKDKIKEQQGRLKESKAKLKTRLKEQKASIAEEKKKEIRQITEKYKNKLHKVQKNNEKERKKLDKDHNIALQKLSYDRKQIQTKMETQKNIAKHDHEQKAKVLQILESVNQLAFSMDTYKTTSENIHDADDDRITTQCLSELHIACKQLNYDFEKKSVELASILSTKFVITIDGMKYTKQKIQSITCCGENRIAITGYESRYNSFLALIDSEGKRIQFIKTAEQNAEPRCSIAIVSDSKVVTLSEFNVLKVFNTQDLSRLLKADISKITPSCGDTCHSLCVVTDRATNKIYVGARNLNIYVFNEHLIYLETLDLSKIVTSIADILILERHLLVCDESAKRAYIVTRQGGKSTLKQEIKNIGSDEYAPISTCTDKDGFIFMLWSAKKQRQVDCRLAKYSPDGQTVITTRKLNNRTECITIMDQYKGKESLVAASENSKEVVLYTVPQSTNTLTKKARSSTASMGSLGKDTTSLTPSIKGGELKVSNQKNNGQNITDTSALRVPDLDASTSGHSSTQPGTTRTVTAKAKAPILLQPNQQVIQCSDNRYVKRNISTTEINSEVRKQQGNRENSLMGGKSSQALKRTYPTASSHSPFSSSSARNTDVKKNKKEDATNAISNMPAQRQSSEPVYLSHTEVRKQQGNRENTLMGGKSSQAPKRTYPKASNRSPLNSSSARNTDVKKNKKEDATSAISNMPAQRLSGEIVNLSHPEVRMQQGNRENTLMGGKSSQEPKRTYPMATNRSPLGSSSACNTDVKKNKKEDATSSISNMPAQRLSGQPAYPSQTEVRMQQGNRENTLMGGKSSQAPKRTYPKASNRSSLTSSFARNTDVKKNKKEYATSAISNMPAQRLFGEPVNLSLTEQIIIPTFDIDGN